jgi:hypothetical protein
MMKKLTRFISTLLVFSITACTSTYQVSTPEALKKKIKTGGGIITLGNGARYDASRITISRDSTVFEQGDPRSSHSVATGDIRSIEQTHHLNGAIGGLLMGIVAGGAVGGLAGFLFYDRSAEMGSLLILVGLVLGTMTGGATGLVYGAIHGNRVIYENKPDTTNIQLPPVFH